MSEKEIKKYIRRINQNKGSESIFTRELNKEVEIARVWSKQPKLNDEIEGDFSSYISNFFFIKNKDGKCIGAVVDMIQDLHWYILKDYRKQGHLTRALQSSIIPYIFYEENKRSVQKITIEKGIELKNYKNSKKVAMNLGFKPTNYEETEFELNVNDFNWEFDNINEKNKGVSNERLEVLRKKSAYAYKILLKISDELIMSYDNDKGLSEVAKKVCSYQWKIEDINYENKK